MKERARLVVIGNGMAGARLVEELLARGGGDRYRVTIFGDEPYGPHTVGTLKQTTGSFGAGFLVLALVALAAAGALRSLASTRAGWPAPLGAGGAGVEA